MIKAFIEQWKLVVMCAGIVGTAFWLYSDRHNSELFVLKSVYELDKRYADQMHSKEQDDLKRTLDSIDRSQSEMRTDIKVLLKEKK